MAITVTATASGTGSSNGLALAVKVLTGAASTQNGQTAQSAAITTPQLAITPNATGSIVYGALSSGVSSTAFTANAATTFSENFSDTTNLSAYGTFRGTATTTASTPVTLGATAPTGSSGLLDIALAEILHSGTLAEDASSPAVPTPTKTAKTLTTASFTPAANSVLVAMVSADYTGSGTVTMAVSDSASSYTWTQLAGSSPDLASVWLGVPASTPISGTDTGSGADTASVAAAVAAADTGSGADTASVAAHVAATETASGTDSASVAIPIGGATDTGSGADTASVVPVVAVADTGSGADTASVVAHVAASDSGHGADSGSVPVTVFDALPPPPTFPLTPLDVRTELLLAGTWTDITSYTVPGTGPIGVTRGHPDESTTTTPSATQLTLNNRDARFTATNPTGPYYGQLVRNVPLRVSVPEGASYWRSETDQFSYASCPDTAGVSITGDMEIQLDLTLDNWNQAQTLAGKWVASTNQRTWILELLENGTLLFNFSSSGSGIDSAPSTVPVPLPPLRRMCLRVTYASGPGTVTFWTSPPGLSSPVWTQLGTAQTFGAITLFNSTATIQIGGATDTDDGYPGIYGKLHAFQLLSGIAGTVKAAPDFTAQAPGATSFADAPGNTWTLHGTSEISNRKYRLHAETSAWPQSWDPTGTDVTVALTAAGVLRRMSQGTSKPLNSAMNRAYVRLAGSIAPVAYWPAEDGTQATQLASGLGGPAMQIAGAPSLASDSSFLCSLPIPVLNGATFSGAVPAYPGGVDNILRFLMAVPAGGDTNGGIIARMYTTGTITRADLVYSTGGVLSMLVYSGSTLLSTFGPAAFGLNGELVRVSLELQASGGNVACNFVTIQVGANVGLDDANTQTGASVGNVTQVVINPGGLLTGTAIGQISVQPVWDSLFDLAGALDAWQGEQAGVRFKRLCDEETIGFRGQGSLHDTVAMGPQGATALATLLQECVDADRGTMVEPRQVLALGYRTRGSMLNQAPAVTLPYSMLMFPLGETEDDQIVQNDVTAQNADGSFSEQVLTSGALSIQAPPNGVGRYDVSVPVNIAADSALDSEAGWILHMGTVNEPRYPQIDIDLASAEAGISSQFWNLLDLDLGDRLVITSPPPWLPPGSIDQLVQGVTENLGVKILNMAWAGVPQSPWNVLVWNDLVWGRWTTAGATLHASISAGATSMLVDSPNSLWTTSGGDFPFDLILAGERVTVTNITGASSPQTFTITRSINGVTKAQTAGAAVDLYNPPVWSL